MFCNFEYPQTPRVKLDVSVMILSTNLGNPACSYSCYIVFFIVYNVQCAVFSVQSAVFSVKCLGFSVQFSAFSGNMQFVLFML